MNAVKTGDRGAAVEDIQRRLRVLGYELGATGVDGVFLDATREAVAAFQRDCGLTQTGWVGADTWSALVDSTFAFGDRMLYLRSPHFHGADVVQLQRALSTLGFSTGGVDGMFGAFTERAVAEFQYNSALTADGVVGRDTFRCLKALHHIWADKPGLSHSAAAAGMPARSATLARVKFVFEAACGECERVARRANNLVDAAATDLGASLGANVGAGSGTGTRRELSVVSVGLDVLTSENPAAIVLTYGADTAKLAQDVRIAQQAGNAAGGPAERVAGRLIIAIPAKLLVAGAAPGPQHIASSIVDALCMAFA